jgi:hypothetical protein
MAGFGTWLGQRQSVCYLTQKSIGSQNVSSRLWIRGGVDKDGGTGWLATLERESPQRGNWPRVNFVGNFTFCRVAKPITADSFAPVARKNATKAESMWGQTVKTGNGSHARGVSVNIRSTIIRGGTRIQLDSSRNDFPSRVATFLW